MIITKNINSNMSSMKIVQINIVLILVISIKKKKKVLRIIVILLLYYLRKKTYLPPFGYWVFGSTLFYYQKFKSLWILVGG